MTDADNGWCKDSFLYLIYNLYHDFTFSMYVIFTGFIISIYGQLTSIYGFFATGDIVIICGIVLMLLCFISVGYEQSHNSWGEYHK